jgi:plastocyanin
MGRAKRIMVRSIACMLLLAAAVLAWGCGGSDSGEEGATAGSQTKSEMPKAADTAAASSTQGQTAIKLVAKNIAFDTDRITVPAGSQVRIDFENKDEGVPHNFAVYMTSVAEEKIFVGDIISGPKSITYMFTAPEKPGDYYFRCDVHPESMTGTFVVK